MNLHPVLSLAYSQHRTIREQNQTIASQSQAIEVLTLLLEQTRRHVELMVLCAKDRGVALSLVRTSHTIGRLPETGGA